MVGDWLEPGAEAVFYYAVQVSGENLLLTKNVPIASGIAEETFEHAISANEVVAILTSSGASLSIIVLDACRDNPFLASTGQTETGRNISLESSMEVSSRGLAPTIVPITDSEVILAYSTSPGAVALDGLEGNNSPYTKSLVTHIRDKGLEISQVFRRVRSDVRIQTNGAQIPWTNSSLESDFYFHNPAKSPSGVRTIQSETLGLPPPSAVVDDAFWRVVRSAENGVHLERYLQHFPNGRHSRTAREVMVSGIADTRPAPRPERAELDINAFGPLELATGTIGPLPMPVDRLPENATIKFTYSNGGFRLLDANGNAVESGTQLAAASARLLRFAVDRTAFGEISQLDIFVSSAGQSAKATLPIKAEIHPCDLSAGYQHDIEKVGRGIRLELTNAELAIDACQAAGTTRLWPRITQPPT